MGMIQQANSVSKAVYTEEEYQHHIYTQKPTNNHHAYASSFNTPHDHPPALAQIHIKNHQIHTIN